jgi:hypothetical protein
VVAELIPPRPFSALDAVPGDTPASRATSVIVTRPCRIAPRGIPAAILAVTESRGLGGSGSTVLAVASLPQAGYRGKEYLRKLESSTFRVDFRNVIANITKCKMA